MAGRGEACSHLAAIVFLMEYAAKANEEEVCTDRANAWLPPAMSQAVPKRTISQMDFSSPAARLAKLHKPDHNRM